jgi:thiol-disulfide isomerase/thioredoxin
MKRRIWLAGAAAAAGAAGIAAALWREHPEQAPAAFWSLRFERPEGGELVLESLRGKPLLLNFWATWCPPCVTEMPLLDRFQHEQTARGWQVVGLAVDGPTPVREFLARRPMQFAIGLAGLNGFELARTLGNSSGALPFTVVFDAAGRLRQRKLGALHPADLEGWSRTFA